MKSAYSLDTVSNVNVLFDFFQAMLRESWLDDMMHVLEQEESGDDISTADSTLKRHEAISHDIKSRVKSVTFILANKPFVFLVSYIHVRYSHIKVVLIN